MNYFLCLKSLEKIYILQYNQSGQIRLIEKDHKNRLDWTYYELWLIMVGRAVRWETKTKDLYSIAVICGSKPNFWWDYGKSKPVKYWLSKAMPREISEIKHLLRQRRKADH